MDTNNKKKYSSSIILVGDFSPLMFEPLWFLKHDIINQDEYDSIEKNNKDKVFIASAITFFETNNFSFRIEDKRFIIIAKKEPFILLVDIFRKMYELLPSLSIKAFGINFTFHVPCDDKSQYKEIGYKLSPLKYWDALFENYSSDKEKEDSGLNSITQIRVMPYGYISVRFEASKLVKPGIFFAFNFHHEKADNTYEFSDVIDTIEQQFDGHMKKANEISSALIKGLTNEN